jgi:hypothetical protein
VLSLLRLKFQGRVADERVARRPAILIPFGKGRMASARIKPRIWKRERRHRSFHVEITPAPQPTRIYSPAVSTGSYPRALTLRIAR